LLFLANFLYVTQTKEAKFDVEAFMSDVGNIFSFGNLFGASFARDTIILLEGGDRWCFYVDVQAGNVLSLDFLVLDVASSSGADLGVDVSVRANVGNVLQEEKADTGNWHADVIFSAVHEHVKRLTITITITHNSVKTMTFSL